MMVHLEACPDRREEFLAWCAAHRDVIDEIPRALEWSGHIPADVLEGLKLAEEEWLFEAGVVLDVGRARWIRGVGFQRERQRIAAAHIPLVTRRRGGE